MAAISLLLQAVDRYSSVITGLNQGLELVGKTIRAVGTASDLMTGGFGLAFKALSSLANVALSPITGAFSLITSSAGLLQDAISGTINMLWEGIKKASSFAWDSISSIGSFLYDTAKSGLDYIWEGTKSFFSYSIAMSKELGFYLAKSLYDTGNTFEQLSIRMESVFGGSGPAKAALDWAVEFGAKTPLTMEEVVASMIKLKTYGFDPMDGILQKLGDTAYALGTDFDGIVTALGQMQLKGKVTAEELMQLAERNVPAFEILRKKFNLTSDQLGNIGAVGLDVKQAIDAIVESLGDKYAGAMSKASNTVQGALSTTEDTWTVFLKKIADAGPWDALGNLIIGIRDKLSQTLDGSWGTSLAKSIGGALQGIISYIEGANFFGRFVTVAMNLGGELVGTSRVWVRDFLDAINSLFTEVESIIRKVSAPVQGALASIVKEFSKAFRDISPGLSTGISDSIVLIANFAKDNAGKAAKFFVDAFKIIRDSLAWVQAKAKEVYDYLGGTDAVTTIKTKFVDLSTTVTKWLSGAYVSIKDVLGTALDLIAEFQWSLSDVEKLWNKIVNTAWALSDVVQEIFKDIMSQMPSIDAYFQAIFNVAVNGFKAMGLLGLATFDAIVKGAGVFADALPGLLDLAYGVAKAFSPEKILTGLLKSLPGIFKFIYQEFDSLLAAAGETYFAFVRKIPGAETILGIPKAGELTASLIIQRKAYDLEAEARAAEIAKNITANFPELPDFRNVPVIDEQGMKKVEDSFNLLKGNFKELIDLAGKGFSAVTNTAEAYSYKAKVAAGLVSPDEVPGVDDSYMRIEYDAAEGTKKIFERLPGQIGNVSDVMDQVSAKSETFLEKRIRELKEAGMNLGDKGIDIGINMEQLEGAKAELLVSVQDMLKDNGTISEAEIMIALVRFLKGQLVSDAIGENLPIVAVS